MKIQNTDIVSEELKTYYSEEFEKYGATPQGISWRDQSSTDLRYDRMLNVIDPMYSIDNPSILDVGCGYGGLYEYILKKNLKINYSGIDIVSSSIEYAKNKYASANFDLIDILQISDLLRYDYIVCNGVLTLKNNATMIEMEKFMKEVISKMFSLCKIGIAFNLLTTHVRHFASMNFYKNPLEIFAYCISNLSHNVKIDHSYRLFEYTTYVYKSNEALEQHHIPYQGYK